MELSTEILAHYLAQEKARIYFPDLQMNATEIVQLQCYQALQQIQKILQDETLEDDACLTRIDQIIQVLEEIGGDCGCRHDFG